MVADIDKPKEYEMHTCWTNAVALCILCRLSVEHMRITFLTRHCLAFAEISPALPDINHRLPCADFFLANVIFPAVLYDIRLEIMTYDHHLIDYSSQSRRGGDARSKTKTTGRRKTDNAKHGQKRRRKKAKTRDGRRRQRQDNRRSKDVCEICQVQYMKMQLI